MCTSASTTFAWVGAILVNFGYITLIAWGSSTQWPLGFTLCGLYALILFGLANRIYRKEGTQTLSFNRPLQEAIREEEDQALDEPLLEESGELPGTTQSQPDEPSQERTISVLVSLLFGLAVIAMAVTGSFLPVNLLAWSCDDGFGWYVSCFCIEFLTSLFFTQATPTRVDYQRFSPSRRCTSLGRRSL